MQKCCLIVCAVAGVPMFASGISALAQSYPTAPIRVVVPFPPGGPVDALTRIVTPKLADALGQPMVIENRSGASGTTGTGYVAKSAPDGYTLIIGTTTTITVTPRLFRSPPYDPVKDLQPISRIASIPSVVLVHPSLPVKSVRDLISLAKAQPGKLTYGSAGAGTSQHLSMELFKYMAGIDVLHVPYKGGAPAMADLLGGHIMMTIEPLNTAMPQVRERKLRGLGVTTLKRMPGMPDMPTVAETLPNYESALWISLLGPAGLRPQVVSLLQATIVKTLQTGEVRERMAQLGAVAIGDSTEEFAEAIRRESAQWAELTKRIGLTLE